jgi:hypothetical protein
MLLYQHADLKQAKALVNLRHEVVVVVVVVVVVTSLAFFEILRIQLQDSRYRQSLRGNWFVYNFAVNVSKLSGETRRVGEGKDGDIWRYIVQSALVETFHSSDFCGVTFSKTRNTPKNRL